MNAKSHIQAAVDAALTQFDLSATDPQTLQVVPASRPEFGDYQFNGALPLAKILRQKPRDLATQILEKLDVSHICEPPEIAGAGFINFRLKTEWLQNALDKSQNDARLGIPSTASPRKIVIDYPSPNVAKPLHVGHIRTTFIGDAICRMLRFAGHEVVSDNHIGDWGTPIGKVIVGWKKYRDEAAFAQNPIEEMGRLYALINEEGENDPAVLVEARLETAKLQSGDAENRAIWEILRDNSMPVLNALWARVGVQTDVTLGESFYQPMLEGVIADLQSRNLVVESDGALIFPFDEGDLADRPMLVRKGDGGALYATTDLATIKYRMETWSPDEIIYVVDARQSLHFRQLFAAAKKWGYDNVRFHHVAFGTILGENGKAISTRAGVTSKLSLLLDEAQRRAVAIAQEKNPELSPDQLAEIGRVIGIGAVKYADLAPSRTSDYAFSWEKMLSLNGNSAVYLEYAFVRTQAVQRKAGAFEPGAIALEEPSEVALGKVILRFGEAIENALEDYKPSLLCDYLYELAGALSAFWRDCRVIDSPARDSRLRLVKLTGDVMKTGLELLGIETVEQM